jgi:hypothetical protein
LYAAFPDSQRRIDRDMSAGTSSVRRTRSRSGRPWWWGLGLVLPLLTIVSCGGTTGNAGAPASPTPPTKGTSRPSPAVSARTATASPEPESVSVSYSFDGGVADLDDGAIGGLPLSIKAVEGGRLTSIAHGTGLAIAFPEPCGHYGGPDCPRAILESAPNERLNPGTRDIRWGATILLQATQTTKGSNVVQKGYSSSGSQFKLQVDGLAGRPSCVVTGTEEQPHIYVVLARASIADGRWHTVTCHRAGASLSITVDDLDPVAIPVPHTLSVVNQDPLRIGGKGTAANNDQFNGAIDDVFVRIGG